MEINHGKTDVNAFQEALHDLGLLQVQMEEVINSATRFKNVTQELAYDWSRTANT